MTGIVTANRRFTELAHLRALALLLLVSLPVFAAPVSDGPYVARDADGSLHARWIEGDDSGSSVRSEAAAVGKRVVVPAVGALPPFEVQLRKRAVVAADEVKMSERTPIFVVADTHGQFEILVALLQKQKILDARLRWAFGKGRLIFLGDAFDRGPNQTEVLWLIYQLEGEAAKAGGGVHFVLGNHETMILRGNLRYLHPKYPESAKALGVGSYAELFSDRTVLGNWLRTRPAVLKVNQLLCLHGGISREVVERKLTLEQINNSVRDALNGKGEKDERVSFVMGQSGPLWYRGYFKDIADFRTATSDDIDAIRTYFGVQRILVGHTTVPTVTPLYDGKVIAVQVYPHRDEGTGQPVMEALRFDRGEAYRARIDGSVEPLQ